MSTKIYNAYIFDKVYTMHEIMQMFESVRKDMAAHVRQAKSRYTTRELVHLYDFLAYFGPARVAKMYERYQGMENKKLSDYDMKLIWDILNSKPENVESVKEVLGRYFDNRAYDDSESKRRIDSTFDYTAEVVIIPLEDKMLLMYFGNSDMHEIVENLPYLADYHYQNQVDKPESISDEEWEQRKNDWEKALGSDGIPARHGMSVQLFNCGYDMFAIPVAPFDEANIPTIEERAKWLMDYMDDYPNPPEGDASVNWCRYLRSPEYLEWKKNRLEEVQEKLKEIPAKTC